MGSQNTNVVNTDQSIEQAFEQILRANLAAAGEWEAVVLAGEDPEGVHQMRVCLRRMRSALAVFQPAISRNMTASFLNEMRWAATTLDRPRDLDVYIADNLSSEANKWQSKLRKLAMKHREKAYGQAIDFIQGERYATLCAELNRWVETRGWRGDLADKGREVLEGNAIPFASEVLDRQRSRVLDGGRNIKKLDSEALHHLRIGCKKLRYAAEYFTPFYGEPMSDFIRHLKSLQDLLGTLHDAAVMPELQKDLLKGRKNRSLLRYARRLVNKRHKQAKAIRKALIQRWGDFSNTERPWMNASVRLA